MVRKGGLEPPRPFGHRILNPARLPIPPLSRGRAARVRNVRAARRREPGPRFRLPQRCSRSGRPSPPIVACGSAGRPAILQESAPSLGADSSPRTAPVAARGGLRPRGRCGTLHGSRGAAGGLGRTRAVPGAANGTTWRASLSGHRAAPGAAPGTIRCASPVESSGAFATGSSRRRPRGGPSHGSGASAGGRQGSLHHLVP